MYKHQFNNGDVGIATARKKQGYWMGLVKLQFASSHGGEYQMFTQCHRVYKSDALNDARMDLREIINNRKNRS